MKDWSVARATMLTRELTDLDESIKAKHILHSTLRNEAIEEDEEAMSNSYGERIAGFECIRSAIDTLLVFLDSREVKF